MSSTDTLRVAIVAPPYYSLPPVGYGGIERVCFDLAEMLVERGHDVALIGAGTSATKAFFVATTSAAQPEGGFDALAIEFVHACRSRDFLTSFRPDIVHDHTLLGPLTAAGRDAPTVVTAHAPTGGPESRTSEYHAMQHSVHLVAISAAQRSMAADLTWAGTVPNGIDLGSLPAGTDREDFLLYVGRISRHKGVHHAIDAAVALDRPLVIAGSWTIPEEQAYFENEIRPRLGSNVHHVGEVGRERKLDLMSRTACLLFPATWHEPFGLVLVEAMACGAPVAALNRGATAEIVVDGVTGALCSDPADLPTAIAAALRVESGACRARAHAEFSRSRMAERYTEIYRRILAQRSRS